ncbi:MAG TPA: hemerythrin domain-containing protein [Thermoanaerobaculia bacterium]|jgi:hemerythrin superfamily protein|nr:hemerythrin domain-containing protein [Thermoanaerobaculia bacterium]
MPNRMEEMASKAMGKAKEGKAAATGLTGVFRTLAEQHGEVSALLKRAKSSDDPARRTELWQKIRVELLSHERAEMREVYPVLREYAETRTLAEHHDREAKELESMISRLDGTDTHSDAWSDLLSKIADAVQHHATEEETEIFPTAQDTIGKPEAEKLDSKFLAAKQQITSQL